MDDCLSGSDMLFVMISQWVSAITLTTHTHQSDVIFLLGLILAVLALV